MPSAQTLTPKPPLQYPLPSQGAPGAGTPTGGGAAAAEPADPLIASLADAAGAPSAANGAAAPQAAPDGRAAQDPAALPGGPAAGAESGLAAAGQPRGPTARVKIVGIKSGGAADGAVGQALGGLDDRPPGSVPPGLKRQRSRR